jgi:23S rRNA (adenine2503-C2)-methyltransferase
MPAAARAFTGLTRAELAGYFAGIGESAYRVGQVMKWVYHRGVTDFAAMSDLNKRLRARLAADFTLGLPPITAREQSADGTLRLRVATRSGSDVETVLIPDRGRMTLCVSTQAGCMLDCSFCATGKQGFAGNLGADEIVGQVLHGAMAAAAAGGSLTNIVLMGMGEPLLNFDASVAATHLCMDDFAFGISKRRVTISTAGVVPAIRALAAVSDVSLAVSLHAPNDALRDELVPINRKYPIAELLAACRDYVAGLGARRSITFEYTLLAGVNDDVAQARQLARLLAGFPGKVNLIPFNPFAGAAYQRPDPARVRAFQTVLLSSGSRAMLRATRGDDIGAACGQLVGRVADRTRRQERHRQRIDAALIAVGA